MSTDRDDLHFDAAPRGWWQAKTVEVKSELASVRAERDRLAEALREIDRLPRKWGAPLTHPVGDMSDPAYAGSAAWAAVGSEAHLLAHRALGGSLESARAALEGKP